MHVEAGPEARKRAWLVGVDHHVGVADEFFVQLDALVALQIECDGALPSMGVEVQQRDAVDDRPGHLPDVVTLGRFDLDDIGT